MIYAIEYFVGSKFGMWKTGDERYPSKIAAEREIEKQYRAEKAWDLTPMWRRPKLIASEQRQAA